MQPTSTSPASLTPTWLGDLSQTAAAEPDWLWRGYLARGAVTLLSSQWKMGKTTLLAILLNRLHHGRPLADLPVGTGKAVVVSEEDAALWAARARQHALGNHVCVLSRPFATRTTPAQWQHLLDHLLDLHHQCGLSLAVIDTLSAFLPGHAENVPALAMEYLTPLHRLTAAGLSVLLLHHTRKGATTAGQAARGTGALGGFVDILMELHWHTTAADDDRRRRLLSWSRYEQTLRQRVLELTPDGLDYVSRGDFAQQEYADSWELLQQVLWSGTQKLTRQEIYQRWPKGERRPSDATLGRWLQRAVAQGQVRCDGTGRRGDPFYYWLPAHEELWASDLEARLYQEEADFLRHIRRSTA